MEEIITKWPVIAQVILYVVLFNSLLSAVKHALDAVKDQTTSDVDNKIAAFLEKPIAWISKIIDFIGYNPKH